MILLFDSNKKSLINKLSYKSETKNNDSLSTELYSIILTNESDYDSSITERAKFYFAKSALKDGWKVRLCFDPILYYNNWENDYLELFLLKKVSVTYFEIFSYFLKKINNVKKFNLNEESLFLEIDSKLLNG